MMDCDNQEEIRQLHRSKLYALRNLKKGGIVTSLTRVTVTLKILNQLIGSLSDSRHFHQLDAGSQLLTLKMR